MEQTKVHYDISMVKIKDHYPAINYTEVSFPVINNVERKVTKELSMSKSKFPAHKDFQARLQALAIHFAILTDRISDEVVSPDELYQDNESPSSPYKDERLENIEVRTVHISEKKGNRQVVITAVLTFSHGRKSPLNTPLVSLEDDSFYRFYKELDIDVDLLVEETIKYLRGKYAIEQLAMDFDTQEEEEEDDEPLDDDGGAEIPEPEEEEAYAKMEELEEPVFPKKD